ncbi:hypothetical protein KC343_g15193 [Hortaea werneckii]|uniref:Uncharacterized protein n=1 Tax=Hortaea werneckii TaxID=91943 RepID=A0A3M7GUC6_HORWE|nr:hypothetical protein KC352_g27572 [Hortaea werneckii]KAI7547000.1 hypothetical protein KC317_g15253 [Hortaea werneckii]KAI7596812.1 hypothetical protein KC346_g14975 [Hortaea werneckii]KAI7601621.1 hypothetical protein KC343_g15193 [Hortaea werneckii]KAI7630068.1 hypothetical protein KC319_g16770 [Hortaea werneckii]
MAKNSRSTSDKMGDWIRNILSCCDKTEEDERPRSLQISGPTNFRREDISIAGLDPEHQAWIREKAKADAQKMWAHLQPLHSSPSSHFADPNNKTSLPSYEDFTQPRPAPPITTTSPAAGTGATATTTRTSLHSQRRVSASSTPGTASAGLVDKLKAHTRKISGSLGNSLTGYHHYQAHGGKAGTGGGGESGTPYEMRALIDPRTSSPQEGEKEEEGMRRSAAKAQDQEGKMSGESAGSLSSLADGRGRGGGSVEVEYGLQGDGDSGKGLGCAEMVKNKGDGDGGA